MARRARRRTVICLAGLWAAAACPTASAGLVSSAPLSAQLSGAGALSFHQGAGATLAQIPGRLRFRTAGGWRTAGRVLSRRRQGRTVVLTLAAGGARRAQLRLKAGPSGSVSVRAFLVGASDVSAVSLAFRAPAGERFFGFGERSNAVAQRATTVESYVADGPFSPEQRRRGQATIPPAGLPCPCDSTYYPVPWLLSSRGYGVLVDNDETSSFRLPGARGGAGECRVDGAASEAARVRRADAGRALRRFTAATGRQPAPAAPWAFGPVVPDRPAQRRPARRGGGDPRQAARRRRPGLGRRDPAALPAVRH